MEVVHADNSDFWGLRIRSAQLADTGKYECQVNTDPKMNYAMMLTVAREWNNAIINLINKQHKKITQKINAMSDFNTLSMPHMFDCSCISNLIDCQIQARILRIIYKL